ncbi:hypothetical protein JCGZ_03107 [Jatropha curcas]|uniref:Aminotransferase-like plant mobile domain-containing protein n=1 Tax=Jatropha curcas TaxID=180498 RepID=A0A067JDQ0_JATCU|nr:hypothetical protein JCGZ_03107 [Jatropha curcas]
MRSRVVAAGFGDYAGGLRRTQPRFPPAMRYAQMERWNDCTHSFIFGFREMTLTPADFTDITSSDVMARYTAQGYVSMRWSTSFGLRLAAWRELPADARPTAPACTREERDQAARSFIFYIISFQLLCTSQNKGDPAVLACLRDLSLIGSYDWASLVLAHLYHGLDVWTRGSGESNWQFLRPLEVWPYEYRIYPGGPESDTCAEARRIPRYLAHHHHTYSSFEDPHYWRCYLNDRALANLFLTPWEGDAWVAYPPRALAKALTRSRGLLQGYWVDRYFLGERVLEIRVSTAQRLRHSYSWILSMPHMCLLRNIRSCTRGSASIGPTSPACSRSSTRGLWRHQSRQAGAVSRLQMGVDRLWTRLEVEGIPLDFSEDEDDDDDGSSSNDAPPPPPSSARHKCPSTFHSPKWSPRFIRMPAAHLYDESTLDTMPAGDSIAFLEASPLL